MESLLEQFLREEASSHVRGLILDAVHEHEQRSNQVRKKFEFNRFEVTLDFVSDIALVEDVLDAAPSGEVRLRIGEFIRYLCPEGSRTARRGVD